MLMIDIELLIYIYIADIPEKYIYISMYEHICIYLNMTKQ